MDRFYITIILLVCFVSCDLTGVDGACRTAISSLNTLENESGTLKSYGIGSSKDTGDCATSNWVLKTPSKQDMLIKVVVKYLSVSQTSRCGSDNGGYLQMPDGKYLCTRIRSNASKCFLFSANRLPATCKVHVEALPECVHSTAAVYGWPGQFKQFDPGRSVEDRKGFDLDYKYIDCAEPVPTATPSATSTLATSTFNIALQQSIPRSWFPTTSPNTGQQTVQSIKNSDMTESTDSSVADASVQLQPGVIAGISVGIIVLLLLIFISVFFWIRNKNARKIEPSTTSPQPAQLEDEYGYANETRTFSRPDGVTSSQEPEYIAEPATVPTRRPIIEKHAYEGIIMEHGFQTNHDYESVRNKENSYLQPIRREFMDDENGYQVPIPSRVEDHEYIHFG